MLIWFERFCHENFVQHAIIVGSRICLREMCVDCCVSLSSPEIKSEPFQVSLRFIEVLELVSDKLLCESMRNIVFDSQVFISNN